MERNMLSEKEKFALRLNEALDDAGFPKAGDGRQTALAGLLDVDLDVVGQWLKGAVFPKTSKLVKLARLTQVRSVWLLSGVGAKQTDDRQENAFREQLKLEHSDGGEIRRYQPLDLNIPSLSKEAIDIADAYMRLPTEQKESVYRLLMGGNQET